MQNFSIELSKKLSELMPNLREHAYDWVVKEKGNEVGCTEHLHRQIICPAWQAEDLLRNLLAIIRALDQLRGEPIDRDILIKYIVQNIIGYEDDTVTAYQKIEEYLWLVLK